MDAVMHAEAGGEVRFEAHPRLADVALLTLSHPGKFNAMSRAMWRDLKALAGGWPRIPDLRCVVLQGADGHFCAGGDIAEYPGFRFDEAHLRDFHENDVWGALGALRLRLSECAPFRCAWMGLAAYLPAGILPSTPLT